MTALKLANLALRFLLEVGALGALVYLCSRTGGSVAVNVALAVVAPLLAAGLWAVFAAPKAPRRLSGPPLLGFELAYFGLAAIALAVAGAPVLAGIFAVAVALNQVLMSVWGQSGDWPQQA